MATALPALYVDEEPVTPPVTLSPPDTGPGPITLAPDQTAPAEPLPDDIVKKRAEKAAMGLGTILGKTQPEIAESISTGKENDFRSEAASEVNLKNALRRQNEIIELTKQGRAITQGDIAHVLNPSSEINKLSDPLDVIEKAYSSNYVSSAGTAAASIQSPLISDAGKDIPDILEKTMVKADELTAKLELARTLQQNMEAAVKAKAWFSFKAFGHEFNPGIDDVKGLFQPYNEYMMRGNNPAVGKLTGGLLLGNNIKEQADRLFELPYDQYKAGLIRIVGELRKDNPTLAGEFLSYITQPSEINRKMQNVFTILTPFDYAGLGKLSKTLVRNIELNNRVNKAFKDVVASTAKVDGDVPIKAVMEEGAGDIGNAGITRATENVVKTLDGTLDPVKDIKEKLTSNFRLDGDLLDSQPGNLSREQLTRLKDGFYESGYNLYETIVNALKVNRTPIPLASEDALRAYQQAAKSDYPGINNAIADIGSPRYEPITNTYHVPFTFTNIGGELFSTPEKAVAFAKMHGFVDPRVMSADGRVLMEESKLVGSKTDLNVKTRLEKSIPETERLMKDYRNKAYDKKLDEATRTDAKERYKSIREILERDKKSLEEATGRLTLSDPVIEQQGVGWKFTIIRPYKETDDIVRKFLINKNAEGKFVGPGASTASVEGWDSWKNSFLGWIRGADDTLAFNESVQRKVATYTQTLLRQWAQEDAKNIEAIANQFRWHKPQTWAGKFLKNKEIFEQFNDTLKIAKTLDDPATGEKGYFFKTPAELEDYYQFVYKRLPSYPEVQAYFSHVKLIEANRVLSEIAEFRNRSRLGTEQHQVFGMKGRDKVGSGFFDGIHQNVFPGGDDNILIMGAKMGDERVYNLGSNAIPGRDLERYRDAVKEGRARVIRIYDPDSKPLESFSDAAGGKRIRYVLSYTTETKPLDLNHVNRRGGGHFEVDSDHYIKQANMVDESTGAYPKLDSTFRRIYTGDTTLMPIGNRVMGRDIIKTMNEVNGHMARGDTEAAREASANLGIEWKELSSWYEPTRTKEGKIVQPRLNPHEPFYLVPRNKSILDLGKDLVDRHTEDLFKDGTKTGSDANQFKVAYNQARDIHDLMTIKDEGSQGNPLYKFVPAEYVDPIPTMNRALNRAINSTFMDDYKMYAVEHWLTEATPYLKATETEVRSAPFWHFNNSDEKAFKSGVDPAIIDNLRSNRYKIDQFVGTPSKIDTAIHGMTQRLADGFYTKFGPEEGRNVLQKAITIVPLTALSGIKEPITAIRSFAFNAKLGVFSLPQLMVQAQTFTTIAALEPQRAMAGTYATMLHTWSRINSNPEVLKAMDKYASSLPMVGKSWKPGEWLEARQELAKTGFEHVGGEHAIADDAMQHKFIKNEWNNFLSAGQVFFKEGERASRLGAYYTAFKEWRDTNPVKVITDTDRAQILQKADLLTVNMSRASSSALHGGVFGLTTQFLSYQLRMAELFFSKRIGETTMDRSLARARLLTMNVAMYGGPSALGITGYPFGNSIREYAKDNGYVVGDKFLSSLVMEGIPAMTLNLISGRGDPQKGNFYNVGNRYGSQGFTAVSESLKSDGNMWKVLMGAGPSSIINTVVNLDPFWKAAKSMVSPDEEGNRYKVTGRDLVNVFNEVSSVDAATRWWVAMNSGKWFSKNELYMDEVSKTNATFMALTGLKPQGQDDIYVIKNIKETEKKAWARAQQLASKAYQRGVEAQANNDPDLAKTHFTNMRSIFISHGVPLEMRNEMLANASKGYESQITRAEWGLGMDDVPAGKEDVRQDALTRQMNINDKRK